MAQVFSFFTHQKRKPRRKLACRSSALAVSELRDRAGEAHLSRCAAKELIRQAAALLVELGDSERRVGWMLEDCLDLLLEQERDRKSGKRPQRTSSLKNLSRCTPQGLHDNGVEFAPLVRKPDSPTEDAAQW